MVLWLRTSGSKQVITWKGPGKAVAPTRAVRRLETSVGSVETIAKIFAQLGYEQTVVSV